MIVRIIFWLDKNSNNPSDPKIKIYSFYARSILNLVISGSEITPTDLMILSPKHLVIASPGNYCAFIQTLIGPIG